MFNASFGFLKPALASKTEMKPNYFYMFGDKG